MRKLVVNALLNYYRRQRFRTQLLPSLTVCDCEPMIPPLLSQTWKSHTLPTEAARFRQGWQSLNPQLECRLFDDAEAREVVREVAPGHLGTYDALPYPVMRADIFRYAVLYRDGGLYADIDMECFKPVGHLLENRKCILSIEAHLSARRMRELNYPAPVQIANCIFAAEAGHSFFKAAVETSFGLIERCGDIGLSDVENLTGPRMLTRLYFSRNWPDVEVMKQIVLMAPTNYPNLWPLNQNMHARHHTFGSWKSLSYLRSLRRTGLDWNRWPNPFPKTLTENDRSRVRTH